YILSSLHHLFLLFLSPAPPITFTYTLSLHDALPIFFHRLVNIDHSPPEISREAGRSLHHAAFPAFARLYVTSIKHFGESKVLREDRNSTRLNSRHLVISYAVFCLKKKKKKILLDHID